MTHRAHARYAAEGDSDGALIARHAELIDRAARRLASRTAGAVSPDDLWSAGALGLVDAARKFDAKRDVRFETYAEHRIRGAMLDEMRRIDHLPRRLRDQADQVERARARLGQKLQREPTVEELSDDVGIDSEELAALKGLTEPHMFILDGLQAATVPSDEQVERSEAARALARAVEGLPERLQLVLSLHYVEGLTYREIAKILAVSEPRVCQIHGEAIDKLRAALTER
jgi:RNA polymerase sigma factor for flagellar operon FliA